MSGDSAAIRSRDRRLHPRPRRRCGGRAGTAARRGRAGRRRPATSRGTSAAPCAGRPRRPRFAERGGERRRLDELRTVADDGEDLHASNPTETAVGESVRPACRRDIVRALRGERAHTRRTIHTGRWRPAGNDAVRIRGQRVAGRASAGTLDSWKVFGSRWCSERPGWSRSLGCGRVAADGRPAAVDGGPNARAPVTDLAHRRASSSAKRDVAPAPF